MIDDGELVEGSPFRLVDSTVREVVDVIIVWFWLWVRLWLWLWWFNSAYEGGICDD